MVTEEDLKNGIPTLSGNNGLQKQKEAYEMQKKFIDHNEQLVNRDRKGLYNKA